MQYPVIIEQLNGHYRATIPTLMNLMAEGNTRDDALDQVSRAAEVYLQKIEVTTIDVAAPARIVRRDSPQAWLNAAGGVDPTDALYQEYLAELAAEKQRQREEAEAEAEQTT